VRWVLPGRVREQTVVQRGHGSLEGTALPFALRTAIDGDAAPADRVGRLRFAVFRGAGLR
jgi:hypothetical protein